ncbi:MAG: PSD1 and planctomycete cytochrome C domain-containing protein [Lentisphaerales bacterium]|nr:PSD1 and planctomycete cytochrome C domain-containing protein [Lentisphaerales bacterium]
MKKLLCVLFLFCSFLSAKEIDFNRQIRPILSDKCYFCHGPDADDIKGKLQLHTFEAATKKLGKKKNRQALVPGDLDKSELWQRIITDDEDDVMPPLDSHKALNKEDKDLIAEWIKQGGKFAEHWSYAKLTDEYSKKSIDNIFKAELAKENFSLSKQAEKRTLIRRLSLDLRGLPPTIAEINNFLNDKSVNAWEKQVERYLNDKHYGERMAVFWLDLARFADSVGYHGDQVQKVYPYRDYVINAFNKNKKFDDFTREQLAGDLLPDRQDEHLVASCFNRLNMMTQEGGAQPKEYIAKYGADRVRTVTNLWMGSTLGCAECHDHKYDPLSAKDFYSFKAFFADIKQVGRYGGAFPPLAHIKDKENYPKYEKVAAKLKEVYAAMSKAEEASDVESVKKWQSELFKDVVVKSATSKNSATMNTRQDGSILVNGKTPDNDVYEIDLSLKSETNKLLLEVMVGSDVKQGFGQGATNFIMSKFEVFSQGKKLNLKKAIADFEQSGHLIRNSLKGNKDRGWAVHGWEKKNQVNRHALFTFPQKVSGELKVKISFLSKHKKHQFALFRLSGQPKMNDSVFTSLFKEKNSKKAYLALNDANYRKLITQKAALDKQAKDLEYGRAYFLVTEAVKSEVTRILPRGNWMDDNGEIVEPAIPEFFGKIEKAGRADRLDLANWLVSKDNPLTARVFVNRVWAIMFGRGLAPITEDVGSQGEPPYYPQVIDNLAYEFRNDWDVKRLVKKIAMTETYRQKSAVSRRAKNEDPFNNFISHQNSKRLHAEFVRDNALAVSGLLNRKIGGRSVKPYQPAGHYSQLNFPKRKYSADMNEQQYRRGLYMHWQRTFIHPMLQAFDAPTREESCARRSVSNTPLQALVLLNDPTFNEAAVHMAEKALTIKTTDTQRIQVMFEKTTGRLPSAKELKTLDDYLLSQKIAYNEKPKEITDFLSPGMFKAHYKTADMAAFTALARVLLNLHESITVY